MLYLAYFGRDIDIEDVAQVHAAIADIEFYEDRQVSIFAAGIGKAFGG